MTTSTAAPATGAPAGSAGAADAALPPALAEIVDDFAALGERDRLQLLLELSRELPALAPAEAAQRDRFERVDECQSPLFLAVDVDRERAGAPVRLAFDAPAEAPTTRGFASILHQGLDGLPASDVLGVPDDFYVRLGLQDAVSPLRLRGMAGMLARIKRQVRARLAT